MINISEEMARVIWRILEEVEGYGDLDESFLARFVEDDGYDYEVSPGRMPWSFSGSLSIPRNGGDNETPE